MTMGTVLALTGAALAVILAGMGSAYGVGIAPLLYRTDQEICYSSS